MLLLWWIDWSYTLLSLLYEWSPFSQENPNWISFFLGRLFPHHARKSYLSPQNFPTPLESPSPYIPSLEWVSHHEGSLPPGRWAPLCCIYLDGWGPLNILEMTPLELEPASKFVFGRRISPRHYIMPSTISCGDRFGLCLVQAFHHCSV